MGKRENPYDLLRRMLGARVVTVRDWHTGEILWQELGSQGCASLPQGVEYEVQDSSNQDTGDQQ